MKPLHRNDLYCWSEFNKEKNIDFHSFLLELDEGNLIIDPLPLSPEDERQLLNLGPIAAVLVTNSDHIRNAEHLSQKLGLPIYAPTAEQDTFPIKAHKWLKEGDRLAPELFVLEMEGSKTKGELALLLEKTTLITGDLIRSHAEGTLTLLPDNMLLDKAKAIESVKRLAALPDLQSVIVGDGWPVFQNAKTVLAALLKEQGQ